jgi:GNAT superfamily N-acetyltransferase
MWWRLKRSQFERQQGAGNRRALHDIVKSGEIPGILAYAGDEAVGWCSVAPRQTFGSLNRSRVLKPLDDQPVWSIVCFFVARGWRKKGVIVDLIRGAVDYVRQRGGAIVEAYPTDPRGRRLAPISSFMGMPSVFDRAGFVECARPSEARVIMRYYIKGHGD